MISTVLMVFRYLVSWPQRAAGRRLSVSEFGAVGLGACCVADRDLPSLVGRQVSIIFNVPIAKSLILRPIGITLWIQWGINMGDEWSMVQMKFN